MVKIFKSTIRALPRVLCLAFTLALTTSLYAYYNGEMFTSNHILYEVIDEQSKTCTVESFDYPDIISLEVPEKVINPTNQKQYTVVSITYPGFSRSRITTIKLPSTIRTIGYETFMHCEDLTLVQLPNSLQSIGSTAFEGCKNLSRIELPNSLQTIDHGAFYGCESLTNIQLPNSLQSIGGSAFYNTGLSNVTIPSSVTYIGQNAFAHFEDGKTIDKLTIADGDTPLVCYNPDWFHQFTDVYIGRNWSYETNGTTWINTQSVKLGNKVTELPELALANFINLKSIEIPNSVTKIGPGAFYQCLNLQSVEIPNSVKEICTSAFRVTAIDKLTIPSSVTSLGHYILTNYDSQADNEIPGNELVISDGDQPIVFENGDLFCTLKNLYIGRDWSYANFGSYKRIVETVKIGDRVTKLPSDAFNAFEKLKSISIPQSVSSIGGGAFYNCTELESIDIKAAIDTIPNAFLKGCTSLKAVTIPESANHIGWDAFYNCQSLEAVTIPAKIKSIDGAAFRNCKSLKSIIIPGTVDSIGRRTFADCDLLTDLQFNHGPNRLAFNVTAFENSPVASLMLDRDLDLRPDTPESSIYERYFKSLSDLKLGDNLTIIPAYLCFSGEYYPYSGYVTPEITELTIPDGVVEIGYRAFSTVPIKTLTLPNSVKIIGKSAFLTCEIETLKMSENVETIGEYAFSSNRQLKQVKLPNTLKEIGYCAFSSTGLTSIEIPSSITKLEESVFNTNAPMKSVTIPANIKMIGQYCVNAEKVYIEDSLEPVEFEQDEAFKGIMQLYIGRDIVMPLDYNGAPYGFTEMEGLRRLTVGNLVTEINENLFKECPVLSKVEFGSGLKTIRKGAFKGCALRDVVIPPTVTTIEEGAFLLNNELETVTIGSGIESMAEDAFGDDYDIKNLYITAPNPPTIYDSTFGDYKTNVFVIPSSMDVYKGCTPYWSKFSYQPMVKAERIEIQANQTKASVEGDGNQIQYQAVVLPENTTLKQVFWESSNPEIATVDNDGLVTTAKGKAGSVKITARTLYSDGPVATIDLDVTSGVAEIISEYSIGNSASIADNNVYTLQGVCVLRNANEKSLDSLLPGIYILNGKKLIIK